jgi:arylsulfatase A-like enzyme
MTTRTWFTLPAAAAGRQRSRIQNHRRGLRYAGWLSITLLMLVFRQIAIAEPPNVIFILADDLGYGDLGCYGQLSIQTPHIDRMAAEGMRFTQFYAGSTVCAPSRCVLMTGQHVGRATIRGNGDLPLAEQDVTIAELLRGAGYRSGMIGKWGLGDLENGSDPLRQGFDYFYGYLHHGHAHNYYPSYLFRNQQRVGLKNVVPNQDATGAGVATQKIEYSHDLFAAEALEFIDRNREGRFFLYLALTIPHANNEAGQLGMEVPDLGPYQDKPWPEAEKAHAAMIGRMDADVGRVLQRLADHGIDDKTIVFFTSDNGPHREGGHSPEFHDSNGPLRGIKRDLYEGGIRVPMIVRWPNTIAAGTKSDFIGSFADVLPTLAELTGIAPPKQVDGVSFAPTLLRAEQAQHDYLYWEFYEGPGGAQAVRMGDWKAVRVPAFDGPLQLYNLTEDLQEEVDVAHDHPQLVGRMGQLMAQAHRPTDVWKTRAERRREQPATR